uniref:Basonuclin zinc finger protein 1 n=1 Tax=Erpetoichthys calabaricus TaxID=27687 RepID=A0A8C4TET1_ERPCA
MQDEELAAADAENDEEKEEEEEEEEAVKATPQDAAAICCTLINCTCEGFQPSRIKRRQCEICKHGWVAHALSKLKVHHLYQGSQVEIVQSNVVFDISSLMLYGTQAIPVRLKILLDRLFSVLKQEEVIHILNALDWTLQDYIRGYVLQDVSGKVLDRWAIMTYEEEIATLQQFLRFGETKSIVELMVIQDKEGQAVVIPSTRTNSDIRAFIENSSHRSPAVSANMEKINSSNIHHFENFINNMAFMLPFQFLSPLPAPLIGSPPDAFLLDSASKPNYKIKPDIQIPNTESSLLMPITASYASSSDRNGCSSEPGTKVEAEDFLGSDDFSDSPSTPCNASISSEIAQISPDGKLRSPDKSSGGPKKGRVFCNACEKTFYDKGTLKIHYNAVHLKIKHKCTIEGCNMVFSSLRSRNRHSANPNPRLHMPMNRNNRDKDLRSNLTSEADKRPEFNTVTSMDSRPIPSYMIPCPEPKMQNSLPSSGHAGILFPNLKTVQPVLPFYRSLVTPAELANTPASLPSLPLISSSVPEPPAAVEPSSDPIPKKKSRKSSMPIKIEKEVVDTADECAEDGDSDEEIPLQIRGSDEHENGEDSYETETIVKVDGSVIHSTEKEHSVSSIHGQINAKMSASIEEEQEQEFYHMENHFLRAQGDSVITSTAPSDRKQREQHDGMKSMSMSKIENYMEKQLCNKDSDSHYMENEHRLQNGGFYRILTNNKETLPLGLDETQSMAYTDLHGVAIDKETLHYCEICDKTFKNQYSVKMHYRNVHLKELHMCSVDGCNAAFPSRRSRDRHSANMNLHHKLLTKDQYGASGTHCFSPAPCRDLDKDFQPDFRLKEYIGQTSVILKGSNRMGLVFPMSKTGESCLDMQKEDAAEEEAVLDLSTSSMSKSESSLHCSWDSDCGSEEGISLDESVESPESLNLTSKEESPPNLPVTEKTSDCLVFHLPSSSPITCHICQKVYSNKGTFRAHYKTVHLRQLHKCKIPGCNTMFSSVRSRNRHSQNPNLHRNLGSSTCDERI